LNLNCLLPQSVAYVANSKTGKHEVYAAISDVRSGKILFSIVSFVIMSVILIKNNVPHSLAFINWNRHGGLHG
jgi:hypothetical protein